MSRDPSKPSDSISHQALDIQKDIARGEGFETGRAKMHENLCTFIEGERRKGIKTVSLELLERLAALWVES